MARYVAREGRTQARTTSPQARTQLLASPHARSWTRRPVPRPPPQSAPSAPMPVPLRSLSRSLPVPPCGDVPRSAPGASPCAHAGVPPAPPVLLVGAMGRRQRSPPSRGASSAVARGRPPPPIRLRVASTALDGAVQACVHGPATATAPTHGRLRRGLLGGGG